MPRGRGRGRGGGRGGGGRGRSTPFKGGVHGAFGRGGPNPFAKTSPPAAGTGKYAHVGFAYASGSGRNSEAELGGGAAEAESEEEEVVYDRLEGAFTGLGFSVQHHAANQLPASAPGGGGEACEESKKAAAEEAATAAAVLRQRAEAAELRAEVAERQLEAANAALVAAGLLLRPTERMPGVSPPAAEAADSAGSVGQAGTAAHEAPTPTVERATAELSSAGGVAAAAGSSPEESTEEARRSAAYPRAQTARGGRGEASGSESDDEAEMDAVWMQAADELVADSNSDDSDGSLDEEGALEAYMAHCEAEARVMAPDIDTILARARRRGAAQSSEEEEEEVDDGDSEEESQSSWETDSQGAEDDDQGGLQQVALHIGGVRVPAGGLSMQAQYPVGRGDARSERDQDRFNVVGKTRHKRTVPGEKARVRAEEMAAKREMRARHKAERNEGGNTVNTAHEESLRKVAVSLDEFVARDGDLWGLPPMPAEILRQARQMASVYGLKTTVQGQGRKQFLLVHKTARAAPPPSSQLEEFIRLHVQGANYTANLPLHVPTVMQLASDGHLNPGRTRRTLAKKARRELRAAGLWDEVQDHTMAAMLLGGGGTRKAGKKAKAALNKQGESKRAKKAKPAARADGPGRQQRAAAERSPMRPMTFVSVGTASVDATTAQIQAPVLAEGAAGRYGFGEADAARTASVHGFGHFEAHTTGFGSRMLAKMGFQGVGAGIGKHSNGVSTPVQAEQRGKKLGLGSHK